MTANDQIDQIIRRYVRQEIDDQTAATLLSQTPEADLHRIIQRFGVAFSTLLEEARDATRHAGGAD